VRYREVGIRLAIGARRREVLWQFLIEAVVLALLGGAIGAIVGVAAGAVATRSLGLPTIVSPEVVVLAFTFSGCVGVLFGLLPARKAARLNPIDARHHE
jgi:putative ABC transport system permease protein